jgi:hypothetical protein
MKWVKTTRVERGEWDSNPCVIVLESCVTIKIDGYVTMIEVNLGFDIRL